MLSLLRTKTEQLKWTSIDIKSMVKAVGKEDAWRANPRERGPVHLIADCFPIDFLRFEEETAFRDIFGMGCELIYFYWRIFCPGTREFPRVGCIVAFSISTFIFLCNYVTPRIAKR